VLQDAGQQLHRDEQGHGWPSGDDAADGAVAGGGDVGGQAGSGADGQRGPGQPARPAASTAVSEQDQGRDDLGAIHRQGKGVGVPARIAVRGGQLAHVTVGNRTSAPASPATVAVAARLIHLSAAAVRARAGSLRGLRGTRPGQT